MCLNRAIPKSRYDLKETRLYELKYQAVRFLIHETVNVHDNSNFY